MKMIRSLFTIAVCALVSSQARASITWNFDGSTSGSNPYSPDTGSLTGSGLSSASLSVGLHSGSTLTTPGSGATAPATSGYLLISGTSGNVAGSTLTFTLNTSASVNLSSLVFDYNSVRLGQSTINWSYTITGSTTRSGTLASETLTQSGAWVANGGESLSGIGQVSAGSIITFVGTVTGGSGQGQSGNIGFDDFSIGVTPVPEPIAYALPLFGLIFIGGTAGRFYLGRIRKA